MARKATPSSAFRLKRDDAVLDILGGVWLVTLLLGLMNLPTFLA